MIDVDLIPYSILQELIERVDNMLLAIISSVGLSHTNTSNKQHHGKVSASTSSASNSKQSSLSSQAVSSIHNVQSMKKHSLSKQEGVANDDGIIVKKKKISI